MILLDTNILIRFYKLDKDIQNALVKIGTQNLAISVVTTAELYFGAFNKTELNQIKRHLRGIRQIPITPAISQRMIMLMESYVLSHRLDLPDALIAATAIEFGGDLFTLNVKHFRYIPNVKLYQV